MSVCVNVCEIGAFATKKPNQMKLQHILRKYII